MKIFNTLQELWNYSEFCPICQESCRIVKVNLGPAPHTLTSSEKNEQTLKISCLSKFRGIKYSITFELGCQDNSLVTTVSAPRDLEPDEQDDMRKASKPYSYIRVMGDCPKCRCTHSNSTDIELDIVNKSTGPISLDREGVYILEHKDKFHLTIIYDRGIVLVSKCSIEPDDTVLDDNKVLELPMVNLDFTDQDKVINKIKTLILFS